MKKKGKGKIIRAIRKGWVLLKAGEEPAENKRVIIQFFENEKDPFLHQISGILVRGKRGNWLVKINGADDLFFYWLPEGLIQEEKEG